MASFSELRITNIACGFPIVDILIQVKVGDVIDVESVLLRGGNAGSEAVRTGKIIVKDIGEEQTKKGRWHVKLLRHKNFSTTFKGTSSSE